jgi:hypothetical protein
LKISVNPIPNVTDRRQDNNALTGRIDQLVEKLEATGKLLAAAMEQIMNPDELRQRQELHEAEQRKKSELLKHCCCNREHKKDPRLTCSDRNTGDCAGLKLCGKTLLYVGGLHTLVPKMLFTADAAFCPVDCVSHMTPAIASKKWANAIKNPLSSCTGRACRLWQKGLAR